MSGGESLVLIWGFVNGYGEEELNDPNPFPLF